MPRIRRSAEFPNDIKFEDEYQRRYRHTIEIPCADKIYSLRYRRTGWHRMIDGQGQVKRKELFGWLMLGKQKIGALELVGFKPDFECDGAGQEVGSGPGLRRRITARFRSRGSILVMKAFPLEYEGAAPAHDDPARPAYEKALEERQAAMIRYYRRLFGVEPLPGENGAEGWLWRRHPRLRNLAVIRLRSPGPEPTS